MRHDIHLNERVFSSKKVAEEVVMQHPLFECMATFRVKAYEFLKEGNPHIFVQSDIGAFIALRDTDKSLEDTAKDLQQKERLEWTNDLADMCEVNIQLIKRYVSV
jgi:hypothetical protein